MSRLGVFVNLFFPLSMQTESQKLKVWYLIGGGSDLIGAGGRWEMPRRGSRPEIPTPTAVQSPLLEIYHSRKSISNAPAISEYCTRIEGMEGMEEAASLDARSPSYTTPPQIRSPSPSSQLVSEYAAAANNSLFFASSASHTLFPAATPGTGHHHDNDLNDNDNEEEEEEDGEEEEREDLASPSPPSENNQQQPQPNGTTITTTTTTPSTQPQPSQQQAPTLSDADLEDIITHPWTQASKLEFHKKFNPANPSYKNKLRLPASAEARVRHFLLQPHAPLDPNSPADARLKARAKSYTLHPFSPQGFLYRNDTGTLLRRHVGEHEVWGLLTNEHVRSGHKGRDRMLSLIKERFVGYTLEELMFVLGSCRVCQRARMVGNGLGHQGQPQSQVGLEMAQRVKASLGAVQMAAVAAAASDAVYAGAAVPVNAIGMGSAHARLPETSLNFISAAHPRPPSLPVSYAEPQRSSPYQHPPPFKLGNKRAFAGTVGARAADTTRRRSLYATNERGLVAYDVPDWYY